MRPPFLAVSFVLSTVHAGLFGWWLDPLTSKRSDEQLANEVKKNLPFLFSEKRAQIVPSDDYRVQRAFDLAVVTVATEDFWVRFVRVRGQFEVEVASSQLPHRWEDLSGALESAALEEGATLNDVVATRRLRAYTSFADVEHLLRTHWPVLRLYCNSF